MGRYEGISMVLQARLRSYSSFRFSRGHGHVDTGTFSSETRAELDWSGRGGAFLTRTNRLEGLTRIKQLMMSSYLWMEGMQWQTVATPQQALGRMDCGPLTCSLAVGYVRWTRRTNHERLNSRDLQVTNREPTQQSFTAYRVTNGSLWTRTLTWTDKCKAVGRQ
jgi:hypothetical protein